jgi:hypothetical protein
MMVSMVPASGDVGLEIDQADPGFDRAVAAR